MQSNAKDRKRGLWEWTFATVGVLVPLLAFGARPSEAAPFTYVANGGGTVSVIDTATNTVVATVPVPANPGANPFGVAVTPDGKHAYVTNRDFPGSVSVIDTAANTVVATVPVGFTPEEVAVTPDGTHAYVTDDPNGGPTGTVSVIDTATNKMVATVTVGSEPLGVAITPDGKHAYVANSSSNTVSVIDTATNTVVATVPVGNDPLGVSIIPPPAGVPFSAFAAKLEIDIGRDPK